MGDADAEGSAPEGVKPAGGDRDRTTPVAMAPAQEGLPGLIDWPCLCVILTLVATTMSIVVPALVRKQLQPCRDPRCFDYAREMTLSIGQAAEPCTDFYSHVCSNFEDLYPGQSSFLSLLVARMSHSENSVLNHLALTGWDTPGERLVEAFRHCVNQYRRKEDSGLLAIRELLSGLGLSLVATPVAHTESDVLLILVRMSLSFNLQVLVHASLSRSLKQTAENKLEMQLHFRLPVPQVERTVETIEDSLRAVTHNGTLSRFHHLADAVQSSMTHLMSRVSSTPRWDGGILYVRFVDVRDQLLSIVEPPQLLNVSNSAVYVEGYFTDESELATRTPTLLATLAAFSYQEGAARLLNLARYLLIERLLPVSASNLAEIYNLTAKQALRVRATACRREASGLLPRAWAELVFRDFMGQKYDLEEAISRDVKDAALPLHADWMDGSTLEKAKERLQRTSFVVGLGSKVADDLRRVYKHVKKSVDAQPFVLWLLNGLKAGRKRLYDTIRKGRTLSPGDLGDEFQMIGASSNAFLDPVRLAVVISPALLFPPFFVNDAPSAVYYGALGSIIGSLVAQSLDPTLGAHDTLGRKLADSWYSPDSLAARSHNVHCITAKAQAYLGNPIAEEQASEVLAHTLGIRMAHAAYRGQFGGNATREPESNFAASWSGPYDTADENGALQRLFFAAYCFQFCGVSVPNSATPVRSLRARCNLPLMNYTEFGRVFRCPLNSSMYAPAGKNCLREM